MITPSAGKCDTTGNWAISWNRKNKILEAGLLARACQNEGGHKACFTKGRVLLRGDSGRERSEGEGEVG